MKKEKEPEGQFFGKMLEETDKSMRALKGKENSLKGTIMLEDNAYFSEDNLQAAKAKEVEAIIPDEKYRNRDETIKDGKRWKGK